MDWMNTASEQKRLYEVAFKILETLKPGRKVVRRDDNIAMTLRLDRSGVATVRFDMSGCPRPHVSRMVRRTMWICEPDLNPWLEKPSR